MTNSIAPFVSSSISKSKDILYSIDYLYLNGITNIELTGGLHRIPELKTQLVNCKKKYHDLNLRCHNYFPPPETSFVLNLCGTEKIVNASFDLINEAIEITSALDAKIYGIHAGFRVQPGTTELGKPFSANQLKPLPEAEEDFCLNLKKAQTLAKNNNVELYIENNVYSYPSMQKFGKENPFLLCSFEDYERLSKKQDFKLLLDIGHLKVSCNSLGINFEREFEKFIQITDYIHFSDNDGLTDDNAPLAENSALMETLKKYKKHIRNKHATFEIYTDLNDINNSVKIHQSLNLE